LGEHQDHAHKSKTSRGRTKKIYLKFDGTLAYLSPNFLQKEAIKNVVKGLIVLKV
jgi:hypothetical protein